MQKGRLKVRISRGLFKRKEIVVPANIRPLEARIKKSLFDLLEGVFEQRIGLDLFCGSGALGFEAISCGAKRVYFVDKSKAVLEALRSNIHTLGIRSQAKVIRGYVPEIIADFYQQGLKFDFIFADPPYYQGLATKTLQYLKAYDILTSSGILALLCYYKDIKGNFSRLQLNNHFSLFREKKYGQTLLLIFNKE